MSDEARFWDEEAMAKPLTDREKELRDRFVEEYMFDFDAKAACIRLGFLAAMALEYSIKLLDEPYVRQEIAKRHREMAGDPRAEAEATKRQIRAALLREAHYRGPGSSHAARVGSLAKLMSLYDMDAPIKTKNEHQHRGGVMMVPAISSIEEWQKAATASQEQLVEASKV